MGPHLQLIAAADEGAVRAVLEELRRGRPRPQSAGAAPHGTGLVPLRAPAGPRSGPAGAAWAAAMAAGGRPGGG